MAGVRLTGEAERVAAALERDDARHVRPSEERGDLRRHLRRLRVDGLPTADDEVGAELAQRERDRPRGADRVGDGEDAVGEVHRAVGAEAHRLAQRLLGLRRAHRHGDDLVAVAAEAGRVRGGIGVEGIQ